MTNFNIFIFCITLLATISQARRLTDYQEDVITPKLYKIIDRNNKIVLQKTANEEFNKRGLLDFLINNANLEYRMDNILNRQEEKSSGVKKIWIKRIVPHTQKTPNVAFDRVSGLFFKPLVRLHKTKKIQLDNARNIPKLHKITDELNALRTRFSLEKMREFMPEETTYTNEAGNVIRLMREVDTIIGELGLPYLSGKLHQILSERDKEIGPQVEALHRDIVSFIKAEGNKLLRGGAPKIEDVNDGKNEENETIIEVDGFAHKLNDLSEEPQERPCPLFPHLPLWNHWTYSQMLYKDECPEGEIKIGTICSKAPGHRLK